MFIASPIPALMAQFLNNRSSNEENKPFKKQDTEILKKSNFSFFGVWVRSSDKDRLIFCQGFSLRPMYDCLLINDHRNFLVIVNSDNIVLGRYSNYDFAMSVLDELQSCLLSGFGVFEMPKSDIEGDDY